MKNFELFDLAQRLGKVLPSLENLKGPKFHYALIKNIDILQKEIDLISKSAKPSDEFVEYEKRRVALCESFCAKDDKGELLKREIGPQQFEYDIDTESAEWKVAIEKLKTDNSAIILARELQVSRYNTVLDVESEITFHLIDISDVPGDINGEQMHAIKDFIS